MGTKKNLGCFFDFEFLKTEQLNALKSEFILYFIAFDAITDAVQDLSLDAILMDRTAFSSYKRIADKNIEIPLLLLIDDKDTMLPVSLLNDPLVTRVLTVPTRLVCKIHQVIEQEKLIIPRRAALNNIQTKKEHFLDAVNAIIIEKCKKEDCITVEAVCKNLNLTQIMFRDKIKGLTDMTGVQYILYFRLKLARQLLQEREYNIQEIALQTGFLSLSYFSKSFKIVFGVSPKQYLLTHINLVS
jgi:AraC-like DNA-binding protein